MAQPATRRSLWSALAAIPLWCFARQKTARAQLSADAPPGQTMLTIFLHHDESQTVGEIDKHLQQTGWFRDFPPQGVEVVSWYVMMGIGQVVTLSFAAERLREINLLVESEAWGGFHAEFYPTYDYRALYEQLRARMR